ncbi:MFS transporter [Actinoplanes sp. NPDC051411]|uniref:MFS transporter n=1 Tax=Actinoplanes sp. NPDC051411 TaxID=3155522 RepID=UPI00342130A7
MRRIAADRDFALLWLARGVSTAGSAFTAVALPALVYAQTSSPLLTSLLAAAVAAPYLVFGLIAGAQADRADRRRIMVISDLINTVLLASIPLVALTGRTPIAQLLIVAWVSGSVSVWFDAANFGALPALVPRERLGEANSRVYSTTTAVQIGAPALAGVTIAAFGAQPTIAIDAVSFLLSAVFIGRIRKSLHVVRDPDAHRTSLLADIREGLGFLVGEPTIRLFTALGSASGFATGAVSGLLVVYAARRFGIVTGDGRLGLLFMAGAIGSFLGALLLPRIGARTDARVVTVAGMFTGPVLLVALAAVPAWWLSLLLLAAWGAATTLIIVNGITVRMSHTPDRLQSRVNVVGRMLTFGIFQPLGALAAGLLAEHVPVGWAVTLCGLPMILAGLAGLVSLRRSGRGVEVPEDAS